MIETLIMLVVPNEDTATVGDVKQLYQELVALENAGAKLELGDIHPRMRCQDIILPEKRNTFKDARNFIEAVAALEDDTVVVDHCQDLYFECRVISSELILCGDCNKFDVLANIHRDISPDN